MPSSSVNTLFSSSFERPGYCARNTPLSNPGRTAISNFSVWMTSGSITTSTLLINSKWAFNSSNASAESWLGVPRITTTCPAAFDNSMIALLACSTSLWLLPCQISALSKISPDTSTSSGCSPLATRTSSSRHLIVSSERRFTPSSSGLRNDPMCQSPV